MNSLRIRLLAVLAGIVIMGSGYFLIYEEEKTSWIISGGESGGHYDEAAKAIADVLRNSNGWKVEVSGSSGSGDNLTRLAKGEVDLCLVQNDLPRGESGRAVTALYEEVLHVIIKDENKTLSDLAGATVSIGPEGGGTETLAIALFKQFGISNNLVQWRRESLREGLISLREGEAEAVCVVTGIGNALVSEALRKGDLNLLHLGKKPAANLSLAYPFIHHAEIPSGAYPIEAGKGLPREKLPTIGTDVILACSSDLSDSAALQLTKSLNEGRGSLAVRQPLLAQLTCPTLPHHQFPLHEGTRQYYERDEPTFIQNWSEPIALLVSLLAVAWGIGVTLRELFLQRRKNGLDVYFEQVDEITSELVKGTEPERIQAIASKLHDIRRQTTRKLMAEELAANESFVIFQRQLHTAQQMVNEFIRKNENSSKKG
jgi:TRAP transporter TAXI family solute receptor